MRKTFGCLSDLPFFGEAISVHFSSCPIVAVVGLVVMKLSCRFIMGGGIRKLNCGLTFKPSILGSLEEEPEAEI